MVVQPQDNLHSPLFMPLAFSIPPRFCSNHKSATYGH
ncbi:hypothetical protein I3843_Q038900 [Carya illinoinensis]|nr:hypothetical protein I3843_Q038900 [Carya illinoinensis]